MLYKKPICECGRELFVQKSVSTEYYYEITSNGKQKKRQFDKFESNIETNLECKSCNELYYLIEDEMGRIIRGEKIL